MNKLLIALLLGWAGAPALAQVQLPLPRAPAAPAPSAPVLPAGLYVQVLDGMIHVSNPGGTQSFAAGQFGYVPSATRPPVVVPANPGIHFTPPPAFNNTAGPATASGGGKAATVDCEVR